nr:HAD-IIIA family hydrolase [Coxiella-like endosymbiont of Rhipicephalus sanguineus]
MRRCSWLLFSRNVESHSSKNERRIGESGRHIEQIYFCPHTPEANCVCRKPNSGLLYAIAQDFPKAFPDATLVGDSLRDIQAAQKAGCRSVLVKTGNGRKTIDRNKGLKGIPIFEDLSDYVSHLTLKSK